MASLCLAETQDKDNASHFVDIDFSSQFSKPELKKSIIKAIEKNGVTVKPFLLNQETETKQQKNSILVSVGQQAFYRNINESHHQYHVAFYIPETSYRKTLENHPDIKNTLAVFSGQSTERQWSLGRGLLPNTTRFASISSHKQLSLFDDSHKHFTVENNLLSALRESLRDYPLLVLLDDPELLNGDNIRRILLSSYRLNTPVIGPNQSVSKAGGLATVYSNRQQLFNALSASIKNIINGTNTKSCYPTEFQIFINQQLAQSFGITDIDMEILKTQINSAGGQYCGPLK